MIRWVLLVAGLGGCLGRADLSYDWDDRRDVCSQPMDDLTGTAPEWKKADDTLEEAAIAERVALFHAHDPGNSVSLDQIERILDAADDRGLEYLTYDQLVAGPPHAGIALAFDDTFVDDWYSIRDLLSAHNARVTFFLTRWDTITDPQRAELAELHALGHDVEPHTVNHVHAPDFVSQNGLDAYLAQEILPSIAQMRDAGYPPTSLAFPFGETTPEITAAVLEHIDRVRIGPSPCPHR